MLRACLIEAHVDVLTASWSILVGYRGELYAIGDDFSVSVPAREYFAIGSGEDFAHGSLAATKNMSAYHDPQVRVHKAVMTACARRSDCGGQIIVESV